MRRLVCVHTRVKQKRISKALVSLLKVTKGGLVSPPHSEVNLPIDEFRYRLESPAVKKF
jgi:hypothetical protein